jgi:hypothetical protein
VSVHKAPPVLYCDGVKHGSLMVLQAQYDKLGANDASVKPARAGRPGSAVTPASATVVATSLQKVRVCANFAHFCSSIYLCFGMPSLDLSSVQFASAYHNETGTYATQV